MSLKEFQIHSDQWMTVKRGSGLDEIRDIFTEMTQGNIAPMYGIILSI
jgi:hypothetical protein